MRGLAQCWGRGWGGRRGQKSPLRVWQPFSSSGWSAPWPSGCLHTRSVDLGALARCIAAGSSIFREQPPSFVLSPRAACGRVHGWGRHSQCSEPLSCRQIMCTTGRGGKPTSGGCLSAPFCILEGCVAFQEFRVLNGPGRSVAFSPVPRGQAILKAFPLCSCTHSVPAGERCISTKVSATSARSLIGDNHGSNRLLSPMRQMVLLCSFYTQGNRGPEKEAAWPITTNPQSSLHVSDPATRQVPGSSSHHLSFP